MRHRLPIAWTLPFLFLLMFTAAALAEPAPEPAAAPAPPAALQGGICPNSPIQASHGGEVFCNPEFGLCDWESDCDWYCGDPCSTCKYNVGETCGVCVCC